MSAISGWYACGVADDIEKCGGSKTQDRKEGIDIGAGRQVLEERHSVKFCGDYLLNCAPPSRNVCWKGGVRCRRQRHVRFQAGVDISDSTETGAPPPTSDCRNP